MLEEPRVVLSKANQALQTLEKYKKGLDQLTFNLTIRELEDLVTLFDAVQRVTEISNCPEDGKRGKEIYL
ncbi:MAG: hypothetical protein U5N58_14605 [Actinomycetota bacterium]|nr:hypothetical protein [Actinomycetota bacterium]